MPRSPAATLCQNALSRAVGFAAKPRNRDGSTPSTATNLPFTCTRAASTASAACTPCRWRIAASTEDGSEVADTAARSTGVMCPNGATLASVVAVGCGLDAGIAGGTLRDSSHGLAAGLELGLAVGFGLAGPGCGTPG